jgi:hypothetical protein
LDDSLADEKAAVSENKETFANERSIASEIREASVNGAITA